MSANTAEHFEELGGHEHSGNTSYNEVLKHADPETSLERLADWCIRARKEGVL